MIAKIAAAQEPDGYLYTTRTIDPQNPHPLGRQGALGQRAQRQPRALRPRPSVRSGRRALPGDRQDERCSTSRSAPPICSSTPSVPASARSGRATRSPRWASSKLYRVTGNEQYLDARQVPARRARPGPMPAGETVNPRGLDYNQAQLKVIDQTEPVGHAVRAMYMYSGMADVAALDRRREDQGGGRQDLGQPRRLASSISPAASARRAASEGVRRSLRAAQHDRLQRDLRRRSAWTTGTSACSCSTATRSTSTSWSARSTTG